MGYQRRAKLAQSCVRYVLPIPPSAQPTNDRIDNLLDMAQGVARGEIPRKAAETARDYMWTEMDNLCRSSNGCLIGYAACTAISTALCDEIGETIDWDEKDEDLDPYEYDAVYIISMFIGHNTGISRMIG